MDVLAGFRTEVTEADPERWMVLLSACDYPVTAPLFWFTRMVGLEAGWSVAAVDLTGEDRTGGGAVRAAEVAVGLPGRVVLVTKSDSSLAAPVAAEHRLPGIWFTPRLSDPEVAEALRRVDAPGLVVGSPNDPDWRVDASAGIRRAEVLQLPDADHNLEVRSDPARTVELLGRILGRVSALLRRV